ncbi:MAG: ribulokinase [Clostridiales bacterium]|jgi:xylulokinase|nr:ribulokinase [Clostridiales bacterium]MDK2933695.1 ribulokinase [Clostridiales bacterium]
MKRVEVVYWMKKKGVYFIGTDIGTLGTKSVLVDINGQIIASDFAEYGVLTPQPMWAEQWPDVWFDAVCKTIKGVVEKSRVPKEQINGVTISGLYAGSGIPCDENMNPLRPCLIWMDRRATKEVEWVKENIGEDKIFDITANYIDSYYGYTKILWIKNNEPDIWKKIKYLVTPYAYAIYHLTGSVSMDYSSAGNIGGIFDINKRDWSIELLKEMGILREFFPEKLSESSEVVGKINAAGAKLTGLAEGTPVCAGGVDAAVATLSAGAFDEGDHVAMMGTSMCWGFIHNGQRYSKNLISMPHVAYPKEKIYTFAGAATAGGVIKWFRETFAQIEKTMGSLIDVDAYPILDLEARKIPAGSDGLIVLPYFMGDRAPIWNVNARGTICGLTLYHTKGHIFRAFLEAVAYALRNCMEYGKQTGMTLNKELKMVGGATKSDLWKSILADITKFPITCVTGGGEAAYGDALLAAVGVGAVENYEVINDWLSFENAIEPHPARTEVYDAYFKQYVGIYEALKNSMDNLAKLPK